MIRAESRGLAAELGILHNVGPISFYTVQGLAARQIPMDPAPRQPLQATEDDFRKASRVIALHRPEHHPMMVARFPAWADRIDYWHVADIGDISPDVALPAIETHVTALLESLPHE